MPTAASGNIDNKVRSDKLMQHKMMMATTTTTVGRERALPFIWMYRQRHPVDGKIEFSLVKWEVIKDSTKDSGNFLFVIFSPIGFNKQNRRWSGTQESEYQIIFLLFSSFRLVSFSPRDVVFEFLKKICLEQKKKNRKKGREEETERQEQSPDQRQWQRTRRRGGKKRRCYPRVVVHLRGPIMRRRQIRRQNGTGLMQARRIN